MPKKSESEPCIIAIDIGTTAIKFVVFDLALKELFLSEKPIITYRGQPGYSEQNADELLRCVEEGLIEIGRRFSHPMALSFSAAMHSILAVDSTGNAQTKAIIWSDLRSKEEARKLRNSEEGNLIYSSTGTPIHPMSPLCKLLWWKNHHPIGFDEIHKFLSIKEYILFKLTGEYVIDYGMASATGMFEPTTLKWNSKAIEILDIPTEKLSTIISPKQELTLTQEAITRLNLPAQLKVFLGSSDGCLANLGDWATSLGIYAISIGTSGAVRTVSKNFETDSKMRLFSYMLDEEKFVNGGAVNNGGIVLEWLVKFLNQNNPPTLKEINAVAAEAKAGANGLLFLPYLQGERAPFWNPDIEGGFVGLKFLHSQKHLVRAVMEGVMYNICYVMQRVAEIHTTPTLIKASGGFTKSPLWLQMLADISQCIVEVNEGMLSAARGAAMIALEGMGLEVPSETKSKDLQVFEPNLNNSSVYQSNFKRFSQELAHLAGK